MATIQRKFEKERGCGRRKAGGRYMISLGSSEECGKLPILLEYCPCCGRGIKFTRGFQWVDKDILPEKACEKPSCVYTKGKLCPLGGNVERFGLMWVGEKYYSVESFKGEASRQGVSKRITAIPKGFELGETWVLLAHKKAVVREDGSLGPGIFYCFRPTAFEYIVRGDEDADELDKIEKQGYKLVEVNYRQEGTGELEFSAK